MLATEEGRKVCFVRLFSKSILFSYNIGCVHIIGSCWGLSFFAKKKTLIVDRPPRVSLFFRSSLQKKHKTQDTHTDVVSTHKRERPFYITHLFERESSIYIYHFASRTQNITKSDDVDVNDTRRRRRRRRRRRSAETARVIY